MKKIDDEIAWSNAAKLTVVLNFPGSWGQGSITTIADNRRLGYDFDINFTPLQGYSIENWRAYRTDDIETYRESQGVNWNWMQDADPAAELTKMQNVIGVLEWGKDKDIELVSTPQSGFGTFVIKINITESVTIVPLCSNAPGIRFIYPPIKEEGSPLEYYRPTETIIIDLTSPVDPETVRLETNYIEIFAFDLANGEPTGAEINLTESGYFTARWNAGLWRIIIEPDMESASYIENKMITVKLGEEIKNIMEYSIIGQPISFSWKTSSIINVNVTKLEAVYDEETASIKVEWTLTPSHSARISYTVNNSQRLEIYPETDTSEIIEIENVPSINTRNIRDGQEAGNIHRYDIWLQLHDAADDMYRDSSFPITIWNFDGMKVSRANPAELINYADDFKPVSEGGKIVVGDDGANKSYVLMRNITVSAHAPISNFQGKFYGNGNTVTISGLNGTGTNIGLFGAVMSTSKIEGANTVIIPALIRDLTVVYANMTITAGTATHIGGIVGNATGNTSILNCIVRGVNPSDTLAVSASSGDQIIRLGGIAGYFEGNGKIENCLAALSVKYALTATDAHTGEVHIGGIAGETGEGSTANTLRINNEYTSTNTARGPDVTLGRLLINGVTINADVSADKTTRNGILAVGGAVGRSELNTMNDIVFAEGTVSFNRTVSTSTNSIGGIIGHAESTNITESAFYGNIGTIGSNEITGNHQLGGIVGYNQINSIGNYFIHKCSVRTNIEIKASGVKNIGGILGFSGITQSGGYFIITNTFFEDGKIDISGTSGVFQIGGFTGLLTSTYHILNNCGALSGTIFINTDAINNNNLYIGGFISYSSASISNCFSRMDINVYSLFRTTASATNGHDIGGFTGRLMSGGSIINCYAAGTVRVIQNADSPNHVNVGGLVGKKEGGSSNNTRIENSYALGNVIADKQIGTGRLHAGGLVGWNVVGNINNSFAAGQVIAQSASDEAYAGGLVGRREAGTISNSAALGSSVTAKTASARGAGRIYGFPANAVTGFSNFALDTMQVAMSNVYNDNNPPIMAFTSFPVMLENPILGGSISSAAISGLAAVDSSGMNLSSVTMSVGGTLSWTEATGLISISDINLSGLENISQSISRNITLTNSAGNTAVYRIEIRPSRNNVRIVFEEVEIEEHTYTLEEVDGEMVLVKETIVKTITVAKEIAEPLTLADFIISGPSLVSTTMSPADAAGPHGLSISNSAFFTPVFWTSRGFTTANWNFNRLGSEGFPRLVGLSGQ